jgi:hypothetical protein
VTLASGSHFGKDFSAFIGHHYNPDALPQGLPLAGRILTGWLPRPGMMKYSNFQPGERFVTFYKSR